MNFRAFLKGVFGSGILLGLFWLWWQSTTPDLSATQNAKPPAKPVAASGNFTKYMPVKVETTAPTVNVTERDQTAISDAGGVAITVTTVPTEAEARVARAKAALKKILDNSGGLHAGDAKVSYALAHQEVSLPESVNLTVSLDQAEHHVFSGSTGIYGDACVVGYDHGSNDIEYVRFRQLDGNGQLTGAAGNVLLFNLSPEDQDYVRNWAKQQAAAIAAGATEAVLPAARVGPLVRAPTQQGQIIITN